MPLNSLNGAPFRAACRHASWCRTHDESPAPVAEAGRIFEQYPGGDCRAASRRAVPGILLPGLCRPDRAGKAPARKSTVVRKGQDRVPGRARLGEADVLARVGGSCGVRRIRGRARRAGSGSGPDARGRRGARRAGALLRSRARGRHRGAGFEKKRSGGSRAPRGRPAQSRPAGATIPASSQSRPARGAAPRPCAPFPAVREAARDRAFPPGARDPRSAGCDLSAVRLLPGRFDPPARGIGKTPGPADAALRRGRGARDRLADRPRGISPDRAKPSCPPRPAAPLRGPGRA